MTTCAKTKERCGPEALPCVFDEKVEEPKDLRILQGNDINDKKTFAAIMGDANRKSLDAHITRLVYEIVERQYGDLSRTEPFHYILASELDARVQDVARRVAAEKNKPFNADSTKKYLGAHWHSRTTSGPHSAWNYKRVHKITTRDEITYYVLTTAFLFEIHFYNRSIDIFDVLLPVVQDALPAIRAALPWLLPADDNDDVFDADTIAAEVPEIQVAPVPTAEMFFGAALRDAAAGGNEVYEDSVSEDEDTISEDEDTIAESVDVPQHVDNGALDKAIEASESNEMDDQSVFRQLEAGVLVARDRLKAQWAVAAAQAAEVHHLKAEAADHEALAAEVERLEAEAAAQTAEVHRLKAEAADHEALAAAQAAEVHRLKAAARAADRLKTVVELLLEELGAKKTRKRSAQEGSDAETPAPKRIAP
jgi:hypothetical protein